MASVENYFGLKGRLGNLVFYMRGKKSFVRKMVERNESNTEEQQAVRSRFRVAVRFYQRLKDTPLKEVLRVSARMEYISGYAYFMKKNLKVFCADGKIGDYSQLQFSAGKRQKGYNLMGRIDEQGNVTLQWGNGLRGCLSERKDRLMVVLLHEERAFSPEVVGGVEATRKDGKAIFKVSRTEGKQMHLYCCFISPDGMMLSDTQYVCL